jgi:hypothetical protein
MSENEDRRVDRISHFMTIGAQKRRTVCLAVLVFFLLSIIILSQISSPVHAQTSATAVPTTIMSAASSSSPDTNSEIVKLQDRVKTLEDKVLYYPIIMGVLAAFGLTSPFLILKLATNYYKKGLRDAFYKADPRHMPVYIPKRNFDMEKERLQKLGFSNLQSYEFFEEIGERGIVIHSIPGDNFDDPLTNRKAIQAVDELEAFIIKNKEKPYAYVIYIKGQLKEVGGLVTKYDRVVSTNMPIAMAGHLYTLARSLME